MIKQKLSFCFCLLALEPKYKKLVQNILLDFKIRASGIYLVVRTDNTNIQNFPQQQNLIAIKLHQQGIWCCHNYKRLTFYYNSIWYIKYKVFNRWVGLVLSSLGKFFVPFCDANRCILQKSFDLIV